jgi:ABC-type polysaccharide/polyol phosphate export permease
MVFSHLEDNYLLKMNEKNKKQLLLISAWAQLGLYDIRSKYRRTFLGPLWISLSTALSV